MNFLKECNDSFLLEARQERGLLGFVPQSIAAFLACLSRLLSGHRDTHRPYLLRVAQVYSIFLATINSVPQMTGGREMTVGDVISTILTSKKYEQFNTLKAYALAQRFYMAEYTDLDDSDFPSLRDIVEKNDLYVPLVSAQVLQVLLDAKDGQLSKSKSHK